MSVAVPGSVSFCPDLLRKQQLAFVDLHSHINPYEIFQSIRRVHNFSHWMQNGKLVGQRATFLPFGRQNRDDGPWCLQLASAVAVTCMVEAEGRGHGSNAIGKMKLNGHIPGNAIVVVRMARTRKDQTCRQPADLRFGHVKASDSTKFIGCWKEAAAVTNFTTLHILRFAVRFNCESQIVRTHGAFLNIIDCIERSRSKHKEGTRGETCTRWRFQWCRGW